MITVETYLKNRDSFIKVTSDTDSILITDRLYMEGAILIKVFDEEILGFDEWDLVDQLWVYFIDAMDELLAGEKETEFLFPDQPIPVKFRIIEKGNWDTLLMTVGEKKCSVDKKEMFLELLSAADIFFRFTGDGGYHGKIQELKGKIV